MIVYASTGAGAPKPPLPKGRWLRRKAETEGYFARRAICRRRRHNIPQSAALTAPFRQGGLLQLNDHLQFLPQNRYRAAQGKNEDCRSSCEFVRGHCPHKRSFTAAEQSVRPTSDYCVIPRTVRSVGISRYNLCSCTAFLWIVPGDCHGRRRPRNDMLLF